jgi:hypothetical protein
MTMVRVAQSHICRKADADQILATPEELEEANKMMQKFATYAPAFKGPISPKESVEYVLDVIGRAEISRGYAGAFLSHYGNKQWL